MLDDELRALVNTISSDLSNIWNNTGIGKEWEIARDNYLDRYKFNWINTKSGRIVCSIENELNGRSLQKERPIVIKIEPWATDKNMNTDNKYEYNIWDSLKCNEKKYFGTILDHQEEFLWICMYQYIPIYRKSKEKSKNNFEYISESQSDKNYIDELKEQMAEFGWITKDYYGGNVGYDFFNDRTVLIDYGSEIEKI